jgi:hypothetical protein
MTRQLADVVGNVGSGFQKIYRISVLRDRRGRSEGELMDAKYEKRCLENGYRHVDAMILFDLKYPPRVTSWQRQNLT